MTDIASLGISIDSRPASQAATDLDGMVAAGGRAEAAVSALANESRMAMAGLSGISGALGEFDSRAAALKSSVDPLGSALGKVNAQVQEAQTLYRLGAIGAGDYAQAVEVLTNRQDILARAIDESTNRAVGGLNLVSGALGQYAAATESVRSSVDPLYASQQRLASQIESVKQLYAVGAIGAGEYGNAITVLQGRLSSLSAPLAGLASVSSAVEGFADRSARLKASVDPLGSAMDRLNAEIREADALYRVGAIGAAEYANGMNVLEGRLEAAVGAQNALTAAHMRGSKAAGFTAAETLNLSRQFADIGVSAAMGMNPLMILIQQGPQIADIFGTAAARGNTFSGSLVAIGKQLGIVTGTTTAEAAATLAQAEAADLAAKAQMRLAMANITAVGGAEAATLAATEAATANAAMAEAATAAAAAETVALAPLAVILAGVATAAALVAGGIAIFAHEMNKGGESADDLQKRLGLTDDQMKKVGNTAITMGDVISGAAAVAGKHLWEAFGPTLTKIGTTISDTFESAVGAVFNFARSAVGTMGAAYGGITSVWSMLPAAIGDVAVVAANGVIHATEAMINAAIGLMNGLINKANGIAADVGVTLRIPTLTDVQIAGLVNNYAGAARKATLAYAVAAKQGGAEAVAGFDAVVGEITGAIGAARDARVRKQAGDPAKPAKAAGAGAGSSEDTAGMKAFADVTKFASDAMNDLFEAEKKRRDQIDAATASVSASIAMTQLEIDMIGKSTAERVVAIAALRAQQTATEKGWSPEEAAAYIEAQKTLAALQVTLREGQAAYNYEIGRTADMLGDIDDAARKAADGMASAFGDVSKSMGAVAKGIGGLITAYTGLGAKEAAIEARRKAFRDAGKTGTQEYRDFEVASSRSMATARLDAYSDMAAAAKGFFKEGTDGYKAMQVAEIAFRTIETLNTISAMALRGADVASHVAAEGTKATASGVAAYAKTLASLPFPFNLAAGAVVLGALAAVGVAMSGGGGGAAGIPISEQRQTSQGAGSVLGDAAAKSESIAKSLDIVAANTNRDLEYSNGMLKALRSIDDQIGTVAAALAKSFGVGGMLDSSKLGLGTTTNGPGALQRMFLPLSNILPGLFGSTTTRKLQDQGVQFGAGSLDQILNGGLSGNAYQQIVENTKKKAFGFTYSESSKTKTKTSALDGDFLRQTELLIGSLRDGVLAAASTLGITGAEATLAAFKVDLGKLSFKDMKGDEIQAALEGIFGKLADNMAGAILPGLTDLQKVGEGLFETLTRVARQYQVVDVTLSSIGKTFGLVGVSSLGAREHLIDLFGSLDDFTERTAFYAENYLTEAERLLPVQNAVTAELARLGLTGVKTRDQFKAVVQGLDVSTAAGADLFAALMSLAPAFAKITEESQAITSARDALSASYDRESSALEDTAGRFGDIAANLKKYREGLYSGPSAMLSPEAAYQAARTAFEQTAGQAATGNETALGDLQNVSQAYLDASKAYYASSAGYFTDLAAVRDAVTAAEGSATAQVDVATAQLDQLKALVSGYLTLDQSVLSVRDAVANLTALLGGPSTPAMPSAPAQAATAQTTAANDNQAAVITQLQALNDRLDALMAQSGAIATEQIAQTRETIDLIARQLRELQAS